MENNLRRNVMGVIINNEWKVLLWQYVSSGSRTFPKWWLENGETNNEGILREIEEELAIKKDNLNIIGHYKQEYQKIFTEEEIQWKKVNKGEDYRGKTEKIMILKYNGDNSDIDINVSNELKAYNRVSISELSLYIKHGDLLNIIDTDMLEKIIWKIDIF